MLKLMDLLVHNRFVKVRLMAAESLYEMLCADDDVILDTIRSTVIPPEVEEADAGSSFVNPSDYSDSKFSTPESFAHSFRSDSLLETPSPRFTILQTIINMFTDVEEGLESTVGIFAFML